MSLFIGWLSQVVETERGRYWDFNIDNYCIWSFFRHRSLFLEAVRCQLFKFGFGPPEQLIASLLWVEVYPFRN